MTDQAGVHQKFSAVSAKNPDRPAVITEKGMVTYGELAALAKDLSLCLTPFLGRAGRVLICLEPGIPFIRTMLAALFCNAAYVPLHRDDPVSRIRDLAGLPGADLLITDPALERALGRQLDLPVMTLDGLASAGAQQTKRNPAGQEQPDTEGTSHAYIIHTSGSTGSPKAMGISHNALLNLLSAFEQIRPLTPEDRCSLWSALHFDVSVYEIWSALSSGAALCIPKEDTRFSPKAFLEWLAKEKITSSFVPAFMLPPMAGCGLDFHLNRMLTGVEPIPEPLLSKIRQQIPGLVLINGYGPAEAAICATLYPVPDTPSRQGLTPIGKPVPNLNVIVVDKDGHPLPDGEKGELVIQGIQVSDGYINAPGRTAKVFGNNGGGRFYKTGDLGYVAGDGNIIFSGRKDFQIKHKGVRIEPGEVETVLGQFPGIDRAALVLKPEKGNGSRLTAYVAPAISETGALVSFLSDRLPRAMIPSRIIPLERLPMTAQGKIDRHALVLRQDLLQAPRKDSGAFQGPAGKIARIWEAVLETPVLSGNENFLLLGGDSISGVRIMARINAHFRTDLNLNLLFAHPEFNRFAAHVLKAVESASEKKERFSELPPRDRTGLLPDQELIWLFESIHPGTAVYHIPLVYEIKGPLDTDRLETALNQVVKSHTSLTLVVETDGEKTWQRPSPRHIRIRKAALNADQPSLFFRLDDPAIVKWLDKQIRKPFHLARGPLVRAGLLKTGPEKWILCLTVHHIGFDGWSAGVFISDLSRAYSGDFPKAPPLPDFFHHVRLKTDLLFKRWPQARAFFSQYLKEMPVPREAAPDDGFDTKTLPVRLDPARYAAIQAMARQRQTTSFTLLLAIFQLTLAIKTGRTDQATGIAYAGRDSLASEPLTGFFMNTLVVRNLIPFQVSFSRFLAQTAKILDIVFRYREIPFHTLKTFARRQGIDHDLFDALFLMQTMPLPPLTLGRAKALRHPVSTGQANAGLTLELYEERDRAEGRLTFRTAIYTEAEARSLVRTFETLAGLVLEWPKERLDTLTADLFEPAAQDLAETAEKIRAADRFPLSPMQHGMLMETLRAPQGAGCYVEQVVFSMAENIDRERFSRAWDRVAEHHRTMRLGFAWQGLKSPEQYLHPEASVRIEYNDWSEFGPSEQQEYISMFLKADRRLGFNLDHPPAFRVALFKTGTQMFTCIWSFHHAILDGRSMACVLRDLFRAYQDPDHELPPAGSFKRYIAWLHSRQRTKAMAFWRRYLTGFDEPMVFPFRMDDQAGARARRQDHAMALTTGLHQLTLSPVTSRRIKTICRDNGLSINAFLMGAWAVLLSHYTGKTDVVFGATVSMRHFETSAPDQTGLYINTLPVRIQIRPDLTLTDYIAGIREAWKKVRENDFLSLTEIHALSPIQGSAPLSEIYFAYDYQTLDHAVAPYKKRISCQDVKLLERTPAAIFLTAYGTDSLTLSIEYDQRKFNPRTTRQILDHFSTFLKSAAKTPEALLGDLPVLTETELSLIWDRLNTRQGHLPPRSCFHHLFEIQAGINPRALAVTDGTAGLTYGELNTRANCIARYLVERGAGPRKTVLILLDQTPDLIAVLLGVLKSGAAYIPIETGAPKERLRFILADSRPDLLVSTTAHEQRLSPSGIPRILLDRDMDRIQKADPSDPGVDIRPGDLAYIIYTSGTTGRPKGVMIEHGGLASFTKSASQVYDLDPTDRVLQFAAISFDTSAEEIFPTLFAGAALVIRPRDLVQTPSAFFEYCTAMELTVLDLPTAYWHLIVDALPTLVIPPALRMVIIGGETANPDRVTAWQQAAGEQIRLLNTYGPTETTVAATWADLSQAPLTTPQVPIGVPFPTVNLSIVNHFGQPAPPGVTGELLIGGPQVARGYLNREDETRAAFIVPDPAGARTRFFRTGDYAKMQPSGQVLYLGRMDRQIKIRGFRVEPGEIEQTAAAFEMVRDCALVLTRQKGNEIRMTAFVEPEPGARPGEADLREWMRRRLPDYMVPHTFVPVKHLPRTASNKIDYKILEQAAVSAARKPAPGTYGKAALDPKAPEDRYQAGLCDIWEEILNTGGFGPSDNFFDVGGSSLTAIRLVTAIEKRFNISLPVLAVFKFPKLSELAGLLRQKDKTTHFSSISAIQPKGTRPPIFFVAGTRENTRAYRDQDLNDHPFYTVTVFAHKSRNQEIVPMDIWEIARRSVREILLTDSSGPYIIIGYCRYCLVAYEIASQLKAMGKSVRHLIFLDEFWQKKDRGKKPGMPPGMNGKIRHLLPRAGKAFRTFLHNLNKRREKYYTAAGKTVPDTLQAQLMESSFWKAYDGYMPLPYPGDLIVMDSMNWRSASDPRLRTYIQGRLKRIRVKARHKDWFEPAQIRTIIAVADMDDGTQA